MLQSLDIAAALTKSPTTAGKGPPETVHWTVSGGPYFVFPQYFVGAPISSTASRAVLHAGELGGVKYPASFESYGFLILPF